MRLAIEPIAHDQVIYLQVLVNVCILLFQCSALSSPHLPEAPTSSPAATDKIWTPATTEVTFSEGAHIPCLTCVTR